MLLRLINESLDLHCREGTVIWTAVYNNDGVLRPIFYRMPFSEIAVRYEASKYPHPRKLAFGTWVQTSLLTIEILLTST